MAVIGQHKLIQLLQVHQRQCCYRVRQMQGLQFSAISQFNTGDRRVIEICSAKLRRVLQVNRDRQVRAVAAVDRLKQHAVLYLQIGQFLVLVILRGIANLQILQPCALAELQLIRLEY